MFKYETNRGHRRANKVESPPILSSRFSRGMALLSTIWDHYYMEWDEEAFLERYFPASKAANIRKEICGIMQYNGETLYEYWGRFKKDRKSVV